jgi:hypothetical protein
MSMPDTANEWAALVVAVITIVGSIGAFTAWMKNQITKSLAAQINQINASAQVRGDLLKCVLRLSFAIGDEMVKQGANGNLKCAVTELKDVVIQYCVPTECEK